MIPTNNDIKISLDKYKKIFLQNNFLTKRFNCLNTSSLLLRIQITIRIANCIKCVFIALKRVWGTITVRQCIKGIE